MYTQRKTTLLRWHFEFGAISISPPVCSLPFRFLSMQDIAASSWVATRSVAWSNRHLAGWAIDQQNHASIIFNPLPYKKSNIFNICQKSQLLSKLGDTHTHKKNGNHFPVWVSYEHSWPNLGLMGLHTLSNLEDLKAMTPHHHPPKSKVLGIGSLAGHSLAHARSTSIAVRWRFGPGPDGPRQNLTLSLVTKHDWLGNPFRFWGCINRFWGCINQAMYPNDE